MHDRSLYLIRFSTILLGMVLGFSSVGTAQTTTFHKVYDFRNWWDLGYASAANDQGYLTLGTTRNLDANDSTFERSLLLVQSDSQGEQLWSRILLSIDSMAFGVNDQLHKLSNHTYAASGFIVDFKKPGNPFEALLLKFDSSGQVFWFKTYATKGFAGVEYLLPLNDGSFVFCGQAADSTHGDKDMFLAKADSNGQLLWWEDYKSPGRDLALSVIPYKKGFLISGFKSHEPGDKAYTCLILTDSVGKKQQELIYNMGPYDHSGVLYPAANGEYYITGQIDLDADDKRYKTYLLKLNHDLDSMWTATWHRNDRLYPAFLHERPNGDLILLGGSLNDRSLDNKAWLARISNTGTLLWERTFVHNVGGQDYLATITPTPDHGFLLTGTTRDSTLQGTTQQNIWLIKTDTFGCIQPGCHLTDSRGDDPQLNRQVWLKAAPNPFSTSTTIHYRLPTDEQGHYALEVYQLSTGQKLATYPLHPFSNSLTLNGNQWPTGALVAVIKNQGRPLVRSQLFLVR